jgi:hypothetical protein
MIVRTLGSACQLFEIAGRKGGRQIKCAHAHIVCPRFSCFVYPKPRQFVKKIPYMGRTYPNSLSLKKHIRIKHVRSTNVSYFLKG